MCEAPLWEAWEPNPPIQDYVGSLLADVGTSKHVFVETDLLSTWLSGFPVPSGSDTADRITTVDVVNTGLVPGEDACVCYLLPSEDLGLSLEKIGSVFFTDKNMESTAEKPPLSFSNHVGATISKRTETSKACSPDLDGIVTNNQAGSDPSQLHSIDNIEVEEHISRSWGENVEPSRSWSSSAQSVDRSVLSIRQEQIRGVDTPLRKELPLCVTESHHMDNLLPSLQQSKIHTNVELPVLNNCTSPVGHSQCLEISSTKFKTYHTPENCDNNFMPPNTRMDNSNAILVVPFQMPETKEDIRRAKHPWMHAEAEDELSNCPPHKRLCNESHVLKEDSASKTSEEEQLRTRATSGSYTPDVSDVCQPLNTNGKPRARRGSATDPQSVYARLRRERINERLKTLQRLVPNGAKVDIVTMLEEAINYVKFLQLQVKLLSSDEYWIYAPTTYNGINVSFDMQQMGLDCTP